MIEKEQLQLLEYRELIDRLEGNEAVQLDRKMQAVHIAYTILLGNDRDLRQSIEQWKDFDLADAWTGDMEPVDQFLIDSVFRHLHNYLASVKTLVDITRRVVPKIYEGSAFGAEYEERVNGTFASKPFSQFVQQLRNLFLHERIPRVLASMREGRRVTIDLMNLKTWDGWNERSREYLEEKATWDEFPPGRVPLESILQEYTDLVRDFYEWLRKRQRELHLEAYKEREMLREEVRRRRQVGSQ